jgi:hypothetical protein
MDWNDIDIHKIPGTVKSSAKNRRAIAKRNAKSKKAKTSQPLDTDKVLTRFRNKITNADFTPTSEAGTITFKKRRDIVDGYRKLLRGMKATHFLTFMPGRFVEPETLAANIRKFYCRLERKALGKKWPKCIKDRTCLIGFLEKTDIAPRYRAFASVTAITHRSLERPDIKPHYHAFARVPEITQTVLEKYGSEIWEKLMPAGKFHAVLIYSEKRVLNYTTKDLYHYWAPEHVVICKPKAPKT